jgi:zinc protease
MMLPMRTSSAILLAALFGSSAASAAPPKKLTTVEGITEYSLDNGLRVLLFPDASKPTITVNVIYLVGSRHEGYGESGMAHLLEHMMYKGTKRYPRVLAQLEKLGANLNGTTWTDRTNYFEILPASTANLTTALDLEADRMVNAKIAPEDLKSEFSVVRNEFEMGESVPANVLEERMLSSAYLWHNYGKSTIGSKSDIERVPADTLRAFYQKYYQPDNAMLVVAGKFEPAEALKLIEKDFGKLPRPKRKLQATYTIEPQQDGERSVVLRRSGDVQVAGLMYHGAAGSSADFVAESAIAEILTAQPSGRLYKALVETGLAAKLHGEAYPWAEPGVLEIFADVRADKKVEVVRDKMIEIVEGLAKSTISDEELERWRQKQLREITLAVTNSERIGVELSEWAAMGDWRLMFVHRDRVKALTTADVKRVAEKFLKQSNRTSGLFYPTSTPERAPVAEQPDVAKLVAEYKSQETVSAGETFVATMENIEKRTERVTLPSGMKLALLPKKTRGGSVQILLHLRSGNETDLKGWTAVSSLMREAVVRGTRKHSFQQIKDELDKLKADLKPNQEMGGRPGSATFRVETVHASVPKVLELLGEIVKEPTFPKDEMEKLRKEQLAKLEEMLQQPMASGFLKLMQKMAPWPKDDVRYIPSLAEEIERLKATKPEQLAEFHQSFWGGDGSTLVVVGDFDAAELKKLAQAQFGSWKAKKPYQRIPRPYRAVTAGEETVKTPDKSMAFVGTAVPVEMRDDDAEFPALSFADYVYGGGVRSRAWDRLREKDGLSYSVFSFFDADSFDKGGFVLSAAFCAPQNAKKAMVGLVEELTRLGEKGISDAELKEHKKAYQAKVDNDLTNDESVAGLLDETLYTSRTLAFTADINKKIQALTPVQVVTALKKYLKPDALVKVNAGDL